MAVRRVLAVLGPVVGLVLATLGGASGVERLGIDVPLVPVAVLAALVGVASSAPGRLALEQRSAGAAGLLTLGGSAACISGLLAAFGLSVLVPAATTSAAAYSVLLQPARRRVVACTGIVLACSGAALGAQALGWVDGVLPASSATLIGTVLLLFTAPTVFNAADVSRRAARAADALEAEREAHVAELELAALHDALTGLLGRRGLAEPLRRAAQRAAPGALSAVLCIDLDGFKAVNDVHGHAAGDELLVEVSRRLVACVRPADAVARTGGDEFVVVLEGLVDADEAEDVAARVRVEVAREVQLADGARVRVGASTGVVVSDGAHDVEELLSTADAAMYSEKRGRSGRERVR